MIEMQHRFGKLLPHGAMCTWTADRNFHLVVHQAIGVHGGSLTAQMTPIAFDRPTQRPSWTTRLWKYKQVCAKKIPLVFVYFRSCLKLKPLIWKNIVTVEVYFGLIPSCCCQVPTHSGVYFRRREGYACRKWFASFMKAPLKTPVDFNFESMLTACDDKLSGKRAMLALWRTGFGLEFYAVPNRQHLGTTALRSRYARHPCIDESAFNHVKVARGWTITWWKKEK